MKLKTQNSLYNFILFTIFLFIIIFSLYFILTYYSKFNKVYENMTIQIEKIYNNNNNNKNCCMYSYFEKNQQYKDNFQYFINNGMNENIDYYIIINGECSIDLENVFKNMNNIIVIRRENIGFDFGSYCYVINNILKQKYDYYFFINTSVKGPYFNNKDNLEDNDWTKPFIRLFNNDSIKVVGTSINMHHPSNEGYKELLQKSYKQKNVYSHVQSMFFCIKHDYLDFLKSKDFFNCKKINKMGFDDLIYLKEIGLSQIAIDNGWNINCILSKYKNIDYRIIDYDINETSNQGDPYFPNCYFSNTINPNEVIFFKNTRF